MSLEKVRNALVSGYIAALPALSPVATTAYENRKFTPPNAADWARVTVIPNQPDPSGLGEGGTDFVDGIFQIDLYTKQGSGEQSILGNFESLRAYFHAGRYLTSNGQSVVVQSCGRGSGRVDGGFFSIPVTIAFYAHLQRS